MKKLLALTLSLLLAMMCLPAFASEATLKPRDFVNKDTRISLVYAALPQSLATEIKKGSFTNEASAKDFANISSVQSLTEGLMLVNSERTDALLTLYPTAKYIAERNEGLLAVRGMYPMNLCMLIANEKPELLADVNKAIAEMSADGTLSALWEANVAALETNAEPVAVETPKTEGATLVRVGVSGDIPPMDYVSADGKPAGYNTAILAEIAKRANFSLEFVYMDSGARFTALSSGRIDLFFWQLEIDFHALSEETFAGDAESLTAEAKAAVPYLASDPFASADVGWVVKEALVKGAINNNALLEKARAAAQWISEHQSATPEELQAYCAELGVDDVCAVDENGLIALSNQADNIGFDFASDEQSAAFLPILSDASLEIVQDPTPRGADGVPYRYAGVTGGLPGGLTQVGVAAPEK